MLGASDTIVAVATPPGQGGVGIVRVSGPQARGIGDALFRPQRAGARLRSHHLVFGTVIDARDGASIDQGLACLMAAPRSYTGEDVVEFHCHGSPVALQRLVGCCLALGARSAERGEFTLRAFLNGRLDLAQAEAVLGLVEARTATAAQVAALGLRGALRERLTPVVDRVTNALAYLEATIDFVEEDLPEQAAPHLRAQIAAASEAIAALLAHAGHGQLLRDGVRVVLAGRPNAGKSSLLNALLRRDRAIVTPIPGTTRDTLEEAAEIGGLPMFLIDTAGLMETDDPVERLGIARGSAALRSADLIVLVVDASAAPGRDDQETVRTVRAVAPETPLLLARNKCDLPHQQPATVFDSLFDGLCAPVVSLTCAATTGQGIEQLEGSLAEIALSGTALDADATLVESARQRHDLESAFGALQAAERGLREGSASELVAVDLRTVLERLGNVTGLQVSEAVLDRIFSQFCIGK